MEFVDELNGHPDYCYDDDSVDLTEWFEELYERERHNIEELKRNCASLKTSYNLVKNSMNNFYVRNRTDIRKFCNTTLVIMMIYILLVETRRD